MSLQRGSVRGGSGARRSRERLAGERQAVSPAGRRHGDAVRRCPSFFARLKTGDFEAWIHVGQSYPDAQRRDFGRGNSTGYKSPEAFAVIDRLMATADPDEEDALYRRLTEIYRADMPFTRLIPASSDWFVHRRVGGLSTPFRASPDTYMEELWLEDTSR